MNYSVNSSNSSRTFEDAIATTKILIAQDRENQISETEIEEKVATLVSNKQTARGFFATFLTSDSPQADNPCPAVIKALKTAPKVVSELLVKNLAMSSAMAVIHDRHDNLEQLQGSETVCRRTINLIQKINLSEVNTELQVLQKAITDNQGDYVDFLNRWQYDAQQKQSIQQALNKFKSFC